MLAKDKGVVVMLSLKEVISKVLFLRTETEYEGSVYWVRLQYKPKPDSYTEVYGVNSEE